MPPIEAYDPWVTGGLLYFALAWFRTSPSLDEPVSLAEALGLILVYPYRAVAKPFKILNTYTKSKLISAIIIYFVGFMGLGIILAIAESTAQSLNLFPNAPTQNAATLYTVLLPFSIIGDIIREGLDLIPIEVAVVIAVIAFLDIIVGSDRYATS